MPSDFVRVIVSLTRNSVNPPPLSAEGRGLKLVPNLHKGCGALRGSQFLKEVARKEGVTFFRGGCRFYIKIN